jgi:hypothetical protein
MVYLQTTYAHPVWISTWLTEQRVARMYTGRDALGRKLRGYFILEFWTSDFITIAIQRN